MLRVLRMQKKKTTQPMSVNKLVKRTFFSDRMFSLCRREREERLNKVNMTETVILNF